MRSKVLIPIGQGCKKLKHQVTLTGEAHNSRCACHPELYLNRCMGCGDLFHTSAPHTKTCGDRCRKRLSRMRHEKMFQLVLGYADNGGFQNA